MSDIDISDDEIWENEDSCDEVDDGETSDDESDDEIEIEDENSNIVLHNTFVRLTKYERTKILGTRAKQIEMGAAPTIKYLKIETPLEIAERELKMKKLPFKIKRKLPSGEVEVIKLRNLC